MHAYEWVNDRNYSIMECDNVKYMVYNWYNKYFLLTLTKDLFIRKIKNNQYKMNLKKKNYLKNVVLKKTPTLKSKLSGLSNTMAKNMLFHFMAN